MADLDQSPPPTLANSAACAPAMPMAAPEQLVTIVLPPETFYAPVPEKRTLAKKAVFQQRGWRRNLWYPTPARRLRSRMACTLSWQRRWERTPGSHRLSTWKTATSTGSRWGRSERSYTDIVSTCRGHCFMLRLELATATHNTHTLISLRSQQQICISAYLIYKYDTWQIVISLVKFDQIVCLSNWQAGQSLLPNKMASLNNHNYSRDKFQVNHTMAKILWPDLKQAQMWADEMWWYK